MVMLRMWNKYLGAGHARFDQIAAPQPLRRQQRQRGQRLLGVNMDEFVRSVSGRARLG